MTAFISPNFCPSITSAWSPERKRSTEQADEDTFGARVAAFRCAAESMREHAAALGARVSELHSAAAEMHEQAAVLHEHVASLADERTRRLYDRYR